MRFLALTLMVFLPLGAFANTRAMDAANREGLVGTWEALVQDQSMATGVYQIAIPKKGDACLIQVLASGETGVSPQFLGCAAAIELADGNIKIRFTAASLQSAYYDWVEIQGYAVAEGPEGAITGKITKHRNDDPLKDRSEAVAFRKGHWFRDLERVASEASRMLRARRSKDGDVANPTSK